MKMIIDQEISFLNLSLPGVSFIIANGKVYGINHEIFKGNTYDSQCLVSLTSVWHGDKVIVHCSGAASLPEKALQDCIDEINEAINYDRTYNEQLIGYKNMPVLTKSDFQDFRIARTIQIDFTDDEQGKTKSIRAYIWDKEDGTKKYIFDGMKKAEYAKSDEEIIEKVINSYVPKKRIRKIKERDLIRLGIYPISKVFRR